ncbi:hypothetical protein I6F11_00155 [Ensifer sp. NBAIM29]|nr:hypothetical protein [Ensifer sp. NBAIM29]
MSEATARASDRFTTGSALTGFFSSLKLAKAAWLAAQRPQIPIAQKNGRAIELPST